MPCPNLCLKYFTAGEGLGALEDGCDYKIALYDKTDVEGLHRWIRQVGHHGKALVVDEVGLIERVWAAFAPDVLWFEGLMIYEYMFDFPPPEGTPIPIS